MDKPGAIRNRGPGVAAVMLALLLIMCLAESATGSCLSYGHSCWGAHGKRSGRSPVAAPDWYIDRMLRRMTTNSEMDRDPQLLARNNDLSAIFQVAMPDDARAIANMLSVNQELPLQSTRTMEGKPMLDDELLSQIKLWQLMRRASEAN